MQTGIVILLRVDGNKRLQEHLKDIMERLNTADYTLVAISADPQSEG